MKALKAIVIWVLLALIPVQGIAAVVAMAGSAAHRTTVQKSVRAHEAMHQVQHHDAAFPVHVFHEDSKQLEDSCQSDHAQAPGGSCAAFCPLSLWMPAGDLTMPVIESASLRIAYIAFHVPFVVPDRPEHPPRFLSV